MSTTQEKAPTKVAPPQSTTPTPVKRTRKPRVEMKNVPNHLSKEFLAKERSLVKGVFRCYEPRGGNMKFSFKKYKDDAIVTYTMLDGDTYEIPLMVAKHLNNNCSYPKHSLVVDANGAPIINKDQKVSRCSFESLAFTGE